MLNLYMGLWGEAMIGKQIDYVLGVALVVLRTLELSHQQKGDKRQLMLPLG
jgi:hypothetical protein